MLGLLKVCCSCLEIDTQELVDVTTEDFDNTSFLYKLQMCVSSTLDESNSKLICRTCIKQLQSSFKFREMVLISQEVLVKRKPEPLTISQQEDSSYKLDIESKFQSECLIVKTESENPNLTLTHKNDSIEYSFTDNLRNESTILDQSTKAIKKFTDEEQCEKCNEYYWDIEEHFCKEYFNDEETKEVKLNVRRGRLKKRKPSEADMDYECYHCSTTFDKRWKLQKHISRVHTDVKKYICTYCGKGFKQSYHLREHLTSHTGERKFTCSICDKNFQRVSSMKRHARSHERPPGEKTKKSPFLCTVCGKNFPFSNGVQRHMRIHLGIKNHECSICHRKFTQSTHLYVHMRTHTGEKPYICDMCGEAFTFNAGLKKHMTIHKIPSNMLDHMYNIAS